MKKKEKQRKAKEKRRRRRKEETGKVDNTEAVGSIESENLCWCH